MQSCSQKSAAVHGFLNAFCVSVCSIRAQNWSIITNAIVFMDIVSVVAHLAVREFPEARVYDDSYTVYQESKSHEHLWKFMNSGISYVDKFPSLYKSLFTKLNRYSRASLSVWRRMSVSRRRLPAEGYEQRCKVSVCVHTFSSLFLNAAYDCNLLRYKIQDQPRKFTKTDVKATESYECRCTAFTVSYSRFENSWRAVWTATTRNP